MRTSSGNSVTAHLFQGSARILSAEALALPCGLILTTVLARQLGPAVFGKYVLVVAVGAWLEWTLSTLYSRASIKLVGQDLEGKSFVETVLFLYVVTGLSIAAILFVASELIASKLGEPSLAVYLRWFAIDIPICGASQAYRSILVGREAFRERAWLSVIRWISRTLFTVIFVLISPTMFSAISGWILSSFAELLLAFQFVSLSFGKPDLREGVLKILAYAAPLSLLSLVLRFYDKLDLFILKWLGASAEVAGIFGAGQNVSRGIGLISFSIAPPLLATVSRLMAEGDKNEFVRLTGNIYRCLLLLIPLAALCVALSPELILVVFGKAYASTVPLMQPFIYSAFFLLLISISNSILTGCGRPTLAFILTLPILPLAVIGHLCFIPIYGAVGAANVTLFSSFVIALINTIAVFKTGQVVFPTFTFVRAILIACLIWMTIGNWHTTGWLLGAKSVAGVIAILVLLWISRELTADDLAKLRSLLLGEGKK
jgi:O-antigen/teichoic acid export membrane protein